MQNQNEQKDENDLAIEEEIENLEVVDKIKNIDQNDIEAQEEIIDELAKEYDQQVKENLEDEFEVNKEKNEPIDD